MPSTSVATNENKLPACPWEKLFQMSSAPTFTAATRETGPHITYFWEPMGIDICKSSRTTLNTDTFHDYNLWAYCRWKKQKRPSPSFSLKGIDHTHSQLQPKSPTSHQPASVCWLGSSQDFKRAAGHLCLLLWTCCNNETKPPASSWKEFVHTSSTLTVMAASWVMGIQIT